MRILHAAYDPHAAVWSACGSIALHVACPITFIDTKGIDACGCIGSAFNEILPRSPHWLHGSQWLLISNTSAPRGATLAPR
jgi:hypothetical protein